MSRIGKKKIPIPDGAKVTVDGGNVAVKGKLGELRLELHPAITVELDSKEIRVQRHSESKQHRALHGLMRSLIANMTIGVTTGFVKTLEVKGVGYRADVKGKNLILSVGYSQPVEFPIPDDIKIEVDKQNNITVSGINKERVGQVSADIRAIRPPDAYKGKGIRYQGEKIKLKPGKSGV
jgi:large subunit ribosomal protein L6